MMDLKYSFDINILDVSIGRYKTKLFAYFQTLVKY